MPDFDLYNDQGEINMAPIAAGIAVLGGLYLLSRNKGGGGSGVQVPQYILDNLQVHVEGSSIVKNANAPVGRAPETWDSIALFRLAGVGSWSQTAFFQLSIAVQEWWLRVPQDMFPFLNCYFCDITIPSWHEQATQRGFDAWLSANPPPSNPQLM